MDLSSNIIKQFTELTKKEPETGKESTAYGTIVEYNSKYYAKLDGSERLTPITTTANIKAGDRVIIRLKNHSATVTGNETDPSASSATVKEMGTKISEFEVIIADKVSTDELDAEKARIDELAADNVTINEQLKANSAVIDSLQAYNLEVKEKLTAAEADIGTLEADNVDIKNRLTAEEGKITNLETTNVTIKNELSANKADVQTLQTDYVEVDRKLTAAEADIGNLKTDNADIKNRLTAGEAVIGSLDTKYANIDFANIGEAAIKKIFADTGLIKDIIVGDGTITGELVGVTIKGDIIEGGTVKADKLVVLGEDGLYYKLNVDALGETTASSDPKYQNGLDGSVLIAKSITADRVAVTDLVAFGATIGGFTITNSSLYSGVKDSIGNTTNGIYLDKDGQVLVGGLNDYLKFFKDEDGTYKLEISASSMILSSSNKSVETMLNELRNDIDNVDVEVNVGARNYIQKTDASKWLSEWINWMESTLTLLDDRWVQVENTSGEETFGVCPPKISYIPSAGDYILSFEAYSDDIPQLDYCYIMTNSGNTALQLLISITSKATRYKIPITLGSEYSECSLMIGTRFSSGTFYVRDIQLESGNTATDWTPAPEDNDFELSDAVNTSYEKITENTTNIIKDSESIILSAVEDTYVQISEYEEYKSTTAAELSVEKDRIDMMFEETSDLNTTDGEILDELSKFKKHISFTADDGIVIGSGESTIELKIDADGIIFSKNGVQFGYWDGANFLTGNIEVRVNERAQFGNFAYVPRTDGSLSFLKVK